MKDRFNYVIHNWEANPVKTKAAFNIMATTATPRKAAFKKRQTKKARRQVDIKIFVKDFYRQYGKMMSVLSHE